VGRERHGKGPEKARNTVIGGSYKFTLTAQHLSLFSRLRRFRKELQTELQFKQAGATAQGNSGEEQWRNLCELKNLREFLQFKNLNLKLNPKMLPLYVYF